MSKEMYLVNTEGEGEEPSYLLQRCFKTLSSSELKPKWLEPEECLKIKEKGQDVFIVDPFKGAAFEHLQELKCRVYGPPCVLVSLQTATNLPKLHYPLYSQTMKGMRVCITNSPTQRAEMTNLIQWMWGEYHSDLTQNVTHLIAGEPGSKKYFVAGELGIKIMSVEWVYALWEASKVRNVDAKDTEFTKLRCPIFKEVVLTSSGLEAKDRQEVKRGIEAEGGRYTGEMKAHECTHLVLVEPKGQKYTFAHKWKINIVGLKWFYDSISRGHRMDEALYVLKPGAKTSTPTKEKGPKASLSCFDTSGMSSIQNMSNMSAITAINETAQMTLPLEGPRNPLDDLDVSVFKGDMVLDGCKIFLSGFGMAQMEKLRKVINLGGGTRYNQINETVSHVVMGEMISDHVEQLRNAHFRPHIVSTSWLVESIKKGELQKESDYYCLDLPPVLNPMSPPPKRKLSDLKNSKENSVKAAPKPRPSTSGADIEDDMHQLLSQYMPGAGSQDTTLQPEDPPAPQASTSKADVTCDPDVTCDVEADQQAMIFKGLLFALLGFTPEQEEELAGIVNDYGGSLLVPRSRSVPDYAVVPVFGCPVSITVREVVTNTWLQRCVEAESLLPEDSDPLFIPISKASDTQPLKDCVLCISSFTGVMRDCLLHIAEELGACVREYFNKKPVKGKKASTHLLISIPEGLGGAKYKAAIKWGVPMVTKGWLLECCRTGKRVPEEKFSPEALAVGLAATAEERRNSLDKQNTTKQSTKPVESVEKVPEATVLRNEVDSNENVVKTETPRTSRRSSNKEKSPTGQEDLQTPNREVDFRTPLTNQAVPVRGSCKSDARTSTPHTDRTGQRKPAETPGAGFEFKTPIGLGRKGNCNTPKSLQNLRVRELREDSLHEVKTGPSPHSRGIDSPSAFLNPNVQFEPSFDLDCIASDLATPSQGSSKGDRRKSRKSSMSTEDLMYFHLSEGLRNMKNRLSFGDSSKHREDDDEVEQNKADEDDGGGSETDNHKTRPLRDVTIGVSKKLSAKQAEYNNIVAGLGGDYRWSYDHSCTHFIYQGRSNDNSKEFRTAKDQKKFIVSPFWLTVCQEQNARVDESLFPHNYNPHMTLSVVSTPKETPKSTRRSSRLVKPEVPQKVDSPKPSTPKVLKTRQSVVEEQRGDEFDDDETRGPSDEEMARMVEEMDQNEEGKENSSDSDNKKSDPETGSLEMQEAVSKQLEDFMAATKGQKPGRRKSKRVNSTGSNDPDEKLRPPSRPRSKLASPMDPDSSKSSRSSSKTEQFPECSQSAEVTWDDPTGRQEQEKLANVLHKPYSPTQESLSPAPPGCGFDQGNTSDHADYSSVITMKSELIHSPCPEELKPPPTPEAPSLAFPRPRPPGTAAHPETIVMEPEEDVEEIRTGPLKFLLSGIDSSERTTYGALIEELGGLVHEAQYYDPSCTHLVAGVPTRNEKYLACVSTGKWILHKSYFEACREAGRFVKEESYEWGSEATMAVKNLNNQAQNLSTAAKRWRVKLNVERKRNPRCVGAFQDWVVILCASRAKASGFKRLLEAGGAKVLATRPPFSNLTDATHAFIDSPKIDYQVNLKDFVEAGIHCLKPDYIASFLMHEPPPSVEQYYLPGVAQIIADLSGTKKRKASGTGGGDGIKRSRVS